LDGDWCKAARQKPSRLLCSVHPPGAEGLPPLGKREPAKQRQVQHIQTSIWPFRNDQGGVLLRAPEERIASDSLFPPLDVRNLFLEPVRLLSEQTDLLSYGIEPLSYEGVDLNKVFLD
jgi:hypothetical protein